MTYREILSRVDHTLLKQGATWEQIEAVCDDGLRFGTASVCIPPSFVSEAGRRVFKGTASRMHSHRLPQRL